MADDKHADELLTNEELDRVAGGNFQETAEDSAFLHQYGLCDQYSLSDIKHNADASRENAVKAAWKKCGVEYVFNLPCFGNEYYINGEQVDRETAYAHVRKLYGKGGSAS